MEHSKQIVVNIRGTSGSGKSYIIHQLLSLEDWNEWKDSSGKILGYYNSRNGWAIVGSYHNACGGCDTVRSQDEIEERIQIFLNGGYNVVFEGLLVSTLSSRWSNFSNRISTQANTVFYYLDTPIETCIENIKNRRLQAGNTKPLNENNTHNRVRQINNSFNNLTKSGCCCIRISSKQLLSDLYNHYGVN